MRVSDPRERVRLLVKNDVSAATRVARDIQDPWRRSQALAWVARFAGDDTLRLAAEAEAAAGNCKDQYQRTAVLAWVVAALAECDFARQAEHVLLSAVKQASDVTPAASCAEALILLLQAGMSLGPRSVQPVVDKLHATCGQSEHWRCRRAIRDARRLLAGEDSPRAFFW